MMIVAAQKTTIIHAKKISKFVDGTVSKITHLPTQIVRRHRAYMPLIP